MNNSGVKEHVIQILKASPEDASKDDMIAESHFSCRLIKRLKSWSGKALSLKETDI